MKDSLGEQIHIRLPVKIGYEALEAFLKKKLIGEVIKKEDNGKTSSYAEILDLDLAQSFDEEFDLAVDIKFKTLTTLFKNREGNILLDVSLNFNSQTQQVSVKEYKFNLESKSWLMNNSMEALVNSFLYEKLKQKMSFDFRPLIQKQLTSVNGKLETPVEASSGIFLSGFVENFRIVELLPGEKLLLIFVELKVSAFAEIKEIEF